MNETFTSVRAIRTDQWQRLQAQAARLEKSPRELPNFLEVAIQILENMSTAELAERLAQFPNIKGRPKGSRKQTKTT